MKLFLSSLLLGAAAAVHLTSATWTKTTEGKTVFIKFYAPWCGHCKAMKADWDNLTDEFKNHKTLLVAEVDCDGTGKTLCEKFGIEGFPTLKHGSPSVLEDYEGDRDIESMRAFANDLKPACSPTALENCSEADKAQVTSFMAMSVEDLTKAMDESAAKIKAADDAFEKAVESLQAQYEAMEKTKADAIKVVMNAGYNNLKKVFVHKGGVLTKEHNADEEEEPDQAGDQEDDEIPNLDELLDHEGPDDLDDEGKKEL